MNLPDAVGYVHKVFQVVKNTVLGLVYPVSIGRNHIDLLFQGIDLDETHLDSIITGLVVLVNFGQKCFQFFSCLLFPSQFLVPFQEFAKLYYKFVCLEQYVIDEIVYCSLIRILAGLVSCEEDFESQIQSIVLTLLAVLIVHQKSIKINKKLYQSSQSYLEVFQKNQMTFEIIIDNQSVKNNLVNPLSPALSQNSSSALFLRQSYIFQFLSFLSCYSLITVIPAITLYNIPNPLQMNRSKIRRVTYILLLQVDNPEMRTGPNMISHVNPDSSMMFHTSILSSFILSSILKQIQAIYSLSINMIFLKPCLSMMNLRIENDFCSRSARFCFQEFYIRQSSFVPQWKKVERAAATIKFMPCVQRISQSIRLQADRTRRKLPLSFTLNSSGGGVLPKSFSICLAVSAQIVFFYNRSAILIYFSQRCLVENQCQMAGLSFQGKPSQAASINLYSSTFLLVFKIKIQTFYEIAISSFYFFV